MDDVIQVQDQFYILATASRAAQRSAVLQHGDTFALFDEHGDIAALGAGEQGLYHEGTRYLSRFELRLNSRRPLLLSSRVKDDNELFGADLTNPDTPMREGVLPRDIVHLFRARFLWEATLHERIRIWSYSRSIVPITLTFHFDADFSDIFEVRGTPRSRRGVMLKPTIESDAVRLSYRGLDGEERWAVLAFSAAPSAVSATSVQFEYELGRAEPVTVTAAIRCERAGRRPSVRGFEQAQSQVLAAVDEGRSQYATIETSSERFNQWVRRSAADLRMLMACTDHGEYPYAGVPWFSTPFGRDGIITALQVLWVNPRVARGVLGYLAATQGDSINVDQDCEPGKILHETRSSEMARLGEVPFGRYYGSIDATPLFVVLAGEYLARTGDLEFLTSLWPHVERALEWIDRYGDRDGDGFVEYSRQSPTGLVQQGWKDSADSIFHADGDLADPPIALCEVQAYVYAARRHAATMAEALGDADRAATLRHEAERLRASFEEQFWCDERSTYALALDGHKRPCRVQTSNAGHCLFGGIASRDRARRVADVLVGQDMFSGWGIRTVSPSEVRYNPMSYHNGSVWPHDNGLIAAGFSRYGFDDLVVSPFAGLFEAAASMESERLPELFCGFHRRVGEGPTLYPVACSPQAWASGVVFQLVQASLRATVDTDRRCLTLNRSILPPFLSYLRLQNLDLPFGQVDLLFEQRPLDVSVTVLRKRGDFEVVVVK
jgi:glycogen debranching enzyme